MFGFGKKKKQETENNENVDLEKEAAKIPSGMKETAERMMSGQFDMNDMLAAAMKEKIKDGSVDAQIKILEAMTAQERAEPEKVFANAKARIAEKAGCTVRDVEHIIKQYLKMKQQMAMIQRMGGMEAVMQRMQQAGTLPGAK